MLTAKSFQLIIPTVSASTGSSVMASKLVLIIITIIIISINHIITIIITINQRKDKTFRTITVTIKTESSRE